MAWKWEWNGETDYYDEEITRDTDWAAVPQEDGESIPVSGGRIQEWLKNEINGKYGVIRISETIDEQNFYSLEMFSTKEDEELYDSDPETYADRMTKVTIPISSVQKDRFSAMLSTSLPVNDIVVVDNKLEVPFNFHAVKITAIGSENAGNKGTLIIQKSTDGGTTWNDAGTIKNALTSFDYGIDTEETIDLGEFLSQGKQLIRVRATYTHEDNGVEEVVNSSYIYIGASITKTTLKLDLVTNFEQPISAYDVNGNTNPFSVTYSVYGSVQKTHYVKIDNGTALKYEYDSSVDSINKTVSTTVAGYITHGVHKVESWLECQDGLGNTLKSDVLINRFMVVNDQTSGADLTKPYLLLQNVQSEIDNFVQTELAQYAVYNPSGESIDVAFLLTTYTEDYETVKPDEYFRLETNVESGKAYSLLTTIEIENEDEGTEIKKYDTYFRVRRVTEDTDTDFMQESTGEKNYYVVVDNSDSYVPVSGATFFMNPKVRNNNEEVPARILNSKNNNAEVESVWTNFGFINDGWMMADDNQKVLRVMAGSTLEIKKNIWKQFLSNPNSSLTFEIDFKIDNVTNTTDPIIQMFEGTTDSFKGLCMNALEGWLMNASNTTKDNCLFSWQEGVRTHVAINLHHQVKPNKGDVYYTAENASKANGTIALARVIMNGDCIREIPFSTTNTNEWCSSEEGSIIIGNEGADIDIYSIRIYEGKVVEMTDILNRNYLATLPTAEEKTKLKERNDLLDGGRISLEKTKNKGLNSYVWHGTLPYHGNQAEQNGWVEIFRYDSDGNYLPEYSGTICKETKSLTGKGQGSTAKTYYDWNLQEDSSKVKATIQVPITKFHSEIHVSSPYMGEDGKQYVDIYGGNLGKNIPIEIEDNAQAYEYVNGMVVVPDGWFDGNGMYRGSGYRVAEGTSLAQKRVIKINYASSMQSHLIGACNTYDLLHRKVVGDTPLQQVIPSAVSAKRTEPFMFFNQQEGGEVYFKGMGTYGAGKADKVTWGFVKKQMPMYALIEGSDNNLPMTGFRVPFDKNTAVYSVDDEGWLYNGQQSFDFDLGNTDDNDVPTDAITQRWADIHNFIYFCSTNLKYFNGTFEEFLQSSAAEDTNYKYWCTQGDQAFNLKRYDFINKEWVNAGLYKTTYYQGFKLSEEVPTSSAYRKWVNEGTGDYSTLNQAFINTFVSHMRKYLKYFINEKSLQFNYCYVLGFLAGTDNSDKNTYYKIDPIGIEMEDESNFAAWFKVVFGHDFDLSSVHQLYFDGDDMDSIFRTNNNSHQTKPYYIDRMHPYADGSTTSLYEGIGNQLFNFVEKAYESTGELSSMMNQIMIAATELVQETDKMYGLESGKVSLWGFLHKYFFNIQHYFPQIAYMEQARIRYEFPELLGFISSGGGARSIRPITQSLGSQLQNELQYMNQRVIYMTSYAAFGAWGGDTTHSIGLSDANETFSFTPAAMPDGSASTYTFTITPHQYIYPSHYYGGTFTSTRQRTSPSQTCTFTIASGVQGSDTGMGICGINYISNLGDFGNKSITSNLTINGKRLKIFETVTFSNRFAPDNINVQCPNVWYINLSTKRWVANQVKINLKGLVRLKTINTSGYINVLELPESSNLKRVDYNNYIQDLIINIAPNLEYLSYQNGNSGLSRTTTFRIGSNVGTNVEGFTVQPIVEQVYSAQKSQSNPNLQSIHVENINWTDFDVEALSWFADRPTCEFKGTIAIKEDGTAGVPRVTWDLKNKFIAKFGRVDTINGVLPTGGLELKYEMRQFNPSNAKLKGNYYVESGNTFKFEVIPGSIYENSQWSVGYNIASQPNIGRIGIDYISGLMTIRTLSTTFDEAIIEGIVFNANYNGSSMSYRIHKTIEIWNRPAQLGDLVYHDGTFSSAKTYDGEKTVVGVCCYVAPKNSDGTINETLFNSKDVQQRLMVSTTNVTGSASTDSFTSWQWGAYPINTGDENYTAQYSLYSINEDGTREPIVIPNLSSFYDIPTITNISTLGLTYKDENGDIVTTSYITNESFRDIDTEEGVMNGGFKLYGAGTSVGDGFAYNETTAQLAARTLTANLAQLAGNGYKEGDVVNSGYAKTLKIIEHRNKVLNTGIEQVGIPALPLPASTSDKTEMESLVEGMSAIRSWAANDYQDEYPNRWSQIYWPMASAAYAYEPTNLKKGEVLADKFKAHNWMLPTNGMLSRFYWYTYLGEDQNIFADAVDAGVFTPFSTSNFWSSTELNSYGTWYVYFSSGHVSYHSKGYSHVGRAVAAF